MTASQVRDAIIYCVCLIFLTGVLIPSGYAAGNDAKTLFEQGNYDQAERSFADALKNQPDDPVLNFYMGRCLLALNQPDKALDYLKRATEPAPEDAEYHFWLGVAYWANMEFEKERQSYLMALKLNPSHPQANLYLGHNYMDRNQWQAALKQYDRVLATAPGFPEALYNRALVLTKMGKVPQAKMAWKAYLDRYQSGKWALRAVDHLNDYGDFSFRAYVLGHRTVVVPSVEFDASDDQLKNESLSALKRIGEALVRNRALAIHVIAYVKANSDLAGSRARAVKKYILETFPSITPSRLKISWFGTCEKVFLEQKTYVLEESVNVIAVNK